MRRSRAKSRLVVLLGIVCILLAWVIYEEAIRSTAIDAMKPTDAADAGTAAIQRGAAAAVSLPDKQSLAVILERPLFAETRRPSGAAASTPGMAVDFTLSGVLITDGVRSALIRSIPEGTVQPLKVGETIDGWTLVRVATDRVVVRRDAVEAELFLDYAAPAPLSPRTELPEVAKDQKANSDQDEQQMNETGETNSNETSGN